MSQQDPEAAAGQAGTAAGSGAMKSCCDAAAGAIRHCLTPIAAAVMLLLSRCCTRRLAEGRSSCALWHAWAMTEGRLGDPSAVRYLFKQALAANARSRYTHLAWAMWERSQVRRRCCWHAALRLPPRWSVQHH